MIVAHNLTAFNAQRHYNIVGRSQAKSTEKLSSGYRINRAADDAAGLAISEKMRRQIRGLDQGARNIQDGISFVQVADGALNEVHGMLQRINELSIKSANGTNTESDRSYIDSEVQELKKELDRIFETTSFNEQKIWGHGPVARQIGEDVEIETSTYTAVTFNSYNTSSRINNNNRGAVPESGISLSASEAGLLLFWTGYDGIQYRTDTIPWDRKLSGPHSFRLSEHMDYDRYSDARGIDFTYQYTVDSHSKPEDVIKGFNTTSGARPSVSVSAPAYTTVSYAEESPRIISSGVNINYDAQLTSMKSFTQSDTAFMEFVSMVNPASPAVSDNTPFSFRFSMPGIGTVNATVSSASYSGNFNSSLDDRTGEDIWWKEYTYQSNGRTVRAKRGIAYPGDGSLSGILDSITNTAGHSLWTDNPSGGQYSMSFSLRSENPYTCMDGRTSTSVGTLSMSFAIPKSAASTQQGLVEYITGALNNLTGIDIYDNDNTSPSTVTIYKNSPVKSSNSVTETIEHRTPIYEYNDKYERDIRIQASGNPDDGIHIRYDNLNVRILGMEDLNVLSEETSLRAIDQIKDAMSVISQQRSDFGSYQNRLEHAYNIDLNVSENTQKAESEIRDTDMSKEMVQYSLKNILLQTGQTMMTQANQANRDVLALLG